jgi:hypothetical protein
MVVEWVANWERLWERLLDEWKENSLVETTVLLKTVKWEMKMEEHSELCSVSLSAGNMEILMVVNLGRWKEALLAEKMEEQLVD